MNEPHQARHEYVGSIVGGAMLRVMVVDDDEMVRRSTCGLLKSYEYFEVVCEGADGAEAVAKARKHRPDIILMDITMPTMNGLDATRVIKREMPGIQIIVLSGQDSGQAALSAGASGFIAKGEVAERLAAEVKKLEIAH
jgi:two-component system response regulator DegU